MIEIDPKVLVHIGNITTMKVSAVVNAANSSLLGGGGVDGAIHNAGGPEILEACRLIRETEFPGGLPTGQAVATVSGRMPCSYIIHTVGPVWRGGGNNEEKLLCNAYVNSLKIAEEKKLDSVAFPAISTGIYGFPKDKASRIAYGAVKSWADNHEYPCKIILVFYSPDDASQFMREYNI